MYIHANNNNAGQPENQMTHSTGDVRSRTHNDAIIEPNTGRNEGEGLWRQFLKGSFNATDVRYEMTNCELSCESRRTRFLSQSCTIGPVVAPSEPNSKYCSTYLRMIACSNTTVTQFFLIANLVVCLFITSTCIYAVPIQPALAEMCSNAENVSLQIALAKDFLYKTCKMFFNRSIYTR